MNFKQANRLRVLPPYPFSEIDKAKEEAKSRGVDLINLGVGDPDRPTPEHIIEAGKRALENPANHQYPSYAGMLKFRQAVANWYRERFAVELNPENEVITLIGSKEGIGHLPLAFIDPGDVVLVPDPGYPVYSPATIFAGGTPYLMPLKEENGFLPDFSSIPGETLKKAKIIYLNYPNNPTGATAGADFFKEVVKLAKRYDLIVAHDNAYSEIYYDTPQPSFLEAEGAKEVGIEFHSLSKTYNMTGWRIGMACGNKDILAGLLSIKSNLDSGDFQVVQEAGIAALSGPQECVEKMRSLYKDRREVLVFALADLGWEIAASQAAFYLWIKIPSADNSASFAKLLLSEAGIIVTPGTAFGQFGEGYIRIALTVDKERLKEAVERIRGLRK